MSIPGVAYLMVSGKGQVEGDGFRRQAEAIKASAHAAGIQILDEFRDEGVSGTSELCNRRGLAALLDRVESNGIQVALVESSQRLARDLVVGEVILAQFRRAGVRVLDCSGNDLTDDVDPTRTLIRQVLGAVAQFDKKVTVLKLRAARDRIRKETGRCEGRKPFGYYEGERESVDLIFHMRRKPVGKGKRRLSYAAIADELNARAVPTRTDRPWHWQTVRRILLRPRRST